MSNTFVPSSPLESVMPHVTPPMLSPDYWVQGLPQAEDLILDIGGIAAFNQQTRLAMPQTMYDLTAYPSALDKRTLQDFITAAAFPAEPVYLNDQPVDPAFYVFLGARRDLVALRERNQVRYGLTIIRTALRTFPTATALFSSPGDREFDIWQETAIGPAEAVLLLHQSSDGAWYYVQSHNYRGWLPSTSVAVMERSPWEQYITAADTLLVVDPDLRISLPDCYSKPASLLFEMGAKLPRAATTAPAGHYAVQIPRRALGGQLELVTAYVPQTTAVSKEFLPYTQANILRQAFKVLNRPYGWGGMHDTVDCSSLVYNVFRSFGLALPRNANQQEQAAGQTINLAIAKQGKMAALVLLPPGSTLHLNGHVMLYLGKRNGIFYALHALAAYGDSRYPDGAGGYRRIPVMRVLVSDLTLNRVSGPQLLESLTVAKTFA